MPVPKPVAQRLEEVLKNRAPVQSLSSKALSLELCNLGRLQRQAAAANQAAYFDKISENAHSANPKLLSVDDNLWESTHVVRSEVLELLARRIDLCREELESRKIAPRQPS